MDKFSIPGRFHRKWRRRLLLAPWLGPLISLEAQDAAWPSARENVSAPAPPAATNSLPTEPLSPVSWRYGIWRGYVAFTAELRYDDNITATDRNIIADFIGVAIPSINLEYVPSGMNQGAAIAHLDYSPQFKAYLNHESYNAVDQTANLKLERTYGRFRLGLNHHYGLTTDPQMEQTGWGELQTQNTDLSAGYELTEKTTLSLSPSQEWSSVDNGITLWEYGATLQATHHKSEKMDLLASYYAGEIQSTPGVNAFKQSALAGISWDANSRNRVDLRVGFQTMTYRGGQASGGNETPDLLLDWNYQLTAKTTAHLSVSYQTYFSQYVAYQVNKTISSQATLSHRLTEKISLELRGGYTFGEQNSVLNNQSSGGEFDCWNAGAGATYHLSRATDLRLDFNHQERSSNYLYQPYQRNVVQLSVQHRF